DFLDKPSNQKTINFSFGKTDRASNLVLRCEGLSKSFGDLTLFENVTFDVLSGERIGITGPNGTGKSTLLRLALGQLEPSAGSIRMGKSLGVGYLDQHGEVLDSSMSVLDEASSANAELSLEQVRNRLGAFLFTGDDVFKKCGDLSGGQRNRLMLCKLVLAEPDVLVMDEPTNHLDIASREMLEEALADYTGTMLVVSHDRYFLDRVVERLIVVGCDELGGRSLGKTEFVDVKPVYSYYASLVRNRVEATQQETGSRTGGPRRRRSASAQNRARPKTPEELRRFNKYSVEQIEELITELELELAEMKERFGDAAIYKNPEQLAELQRGYDAKTEELKLLYRAYERHV
ncbi:MAG: ATP-binding cassette domain-containing protein, partial [Planctomycetota bacterium]